MRVEQPLEGDVQEIAAATRRVQDMDLGDLVGETHQQRVELVTQAAVRFDRCVNARKRGPVACKAATQHRI